MCLQQASLALKSICNMQQGNISIKSALQRCNNKAACRPTSKVALGIHLLYAPVADESKSLTDKGSSAALYDASGLAGAAVEKERSGNVTCC